jgi:hypothetical protein
MNWNRSRSGVSPTVFADPVFVQEYSRRYSRIFVNTVLVFSPQLK